MVTARKLDLSQQLTRTEQTSLRAFVRKLNEQLGNEVVKVVLFGSKARGNSDIDSDIDVLVLVKEENRSLKDLIILIASRVSLDHDVLISPRTIGYDRWQRMGEECFSLYRNISRDGILLLET